MRSRLTAVLASSLLCVLLLVAPAEATYPGKNGKIAFQRVTGDSSQIYTINADGSDQRNLTNDARVYDEAAVWSPDGTKIAFLRTVRARFRSDDRSEIYVMNADGSNKINLTNDATADDGPPTWSPDGTKIAFRRDYQIYTMNADGSNQTNISNAPLSVTAPTWSPDGTKIAFTRSGSDAQVIWVMNVDGSQQINLSHNAFPFDDEFPTWSPDGTKIAFTQFIWRRPSQLYVMNADGSNQTNLTNDPSVGELGPAWSPDGTKIAFGRSWQIYTMNVDGSGKVNLTNDATVRDMDPVWSPDGTKIAFRRYARDHSQVYVMNADGSAKTNISNSPTDDFGFDWQPIPGPKRSDYKNAAKFCKADEDFWGDQFASRYGGGKNAIGKCVSGK